MPFRHAHWYVLGLFPLAGLAFWPQYLSQFDKAPAEFHSHGITASLWLLLLAAQGWSIHHGQRRWHRAVGLSSFALFPLFLAGAPASSRQLAAGRPGRRLTRALPIYPRDR